jgi:hypothetical protein
LRSFSVEDAAFLMNVLSNAPEAPTELAARVVAAVAERRFRYVTEGDLQIALRGVLQADFADVFVPEYCLDGRSRIDFFAPTFGLGVECKATHGTGGSTTAIVYQLMRYAEHPAVTALVFVSGARAVLASVPSTLCGKSVYGVIARGSLG